MKKTIVAICLILISVSEGLSQESAFMRFVNTIPETIVEGPVRDNPALEWDLSARIGLGGSSFAWTGGPVNGTFAFSALAVARMYSTGKSVLPGWYYSEADFGFDRKGAASLGIGYVDLGLLPIGYCYNFGNCQLVGKMGAYIGLPLSRIKYAGRSRIDAGIRLGADFTRGLISFGLAYERGFVNVSSSSINLKNWGISATITCKIMSFE